MELTEFQKQIVELLQKGLSPEKIASKLGREPRVVRAQVTRLIKSKIIRKDALGGIKPKEAKRSSAVAGKSKPPKVSDATDAAMVAAETIKALPSVVRKAVGDLSEQLDVEPMIIFGCTLQFMKLCGGRIAAHQAIEDVFNSLKLFTNESSPRENQSSAYTRWMD